jgi:hypothetical protein
MVKESHLSTDYFNPLNKLKMEEYEWTESGLRLLSIFEAQEKRFKTHISQQKLFVPEQVKPIQTLLL